MKQRFVLLAVLLTIVLLVPVVLLNSSVLPLLSFPNWLAY